MLAASDTAAGRQQDAPAAVPAAAGKWVARGAASNVRHETCWPAAFSLANSARAR